jgi:hypothetical protein
MGVPRAGCHSAPLAGGNGDFVANVFVLGQRFDFVMFDGNLMPTKASADELGNLTTMRVAPVFLRGSDLPCRGQSFHRGQQVGAG